MKKQRRPSADAAVPRHCGGADPEHSPHTPLLDQHDLALALGHNTIVLVERKTITEATAAVIEYVPGGVRFVDELYLPLPATDFAERVEELASAT
ncbi:hypothetical protein ACFY2M_41565 [Streptomyces sp. NPDC001276]|uniref:hypothetical protein n=1 Tax=Streptomyces sp. NPDC001276 TaxID=3364555 RepID=UPI0036C19296